MYLWTRDVFEGDLYLTAEFRIHQHGGLALWMLQAAGMQGEDFLSDYPLRSDGAMSTVITEDVRNYHWEFYREMVDSELTSFPMRFSRILVMPNRFPDREPAVGVGSFGGNGNRKSE